ncbi:MAG: ABC transporter permease [Planctomycetaceae bacterium]|nr:ABC transporter permease [Planctomycetaceae bacterium]
MQRSELILRSFFYYWKTNLALLLGVAVGTAVISGALIVGDSVRYSLQQMTLDRLGNVDYALTGSRFFREEIAASLQQQFNHLESLSQTTVAPAILLTASLQAEQSDPENTDAEPVISTVGQVNLVGLDSSLANLLDNNPVPVPEEDHIIISRLVADQLNVTVGSEISLYVNVPQTIPQESLLGKRDIDELVIELPLTVQHIAEADSTLARFSLQPNQQLPFNAWMNLAQLQIELDLNDQPASQSQPTPKPARINSLFFHQPATKDSHPGSAAKDTADQLTQLLQKQLSLADFHLHLRPLESKSYFALESERMILEKAFSDHALHTAQTHRWPTSPVLVYLANEILNASQPDHFSMYSIAAGIEFPQSPPFGPFLDPSGKPIPTPQPGQAIINSWLAQDLAIQPGDKLKLKYHVVGSRGELPEEELEFDLVHITPLENTLADDPGFTPLVPGITDARTFADWEQPFPMQIERITDRDDEYWEGSSQKPDGYKATPKLFVSLAQARSLWQSRYGDTTSVRIAPIDLPLAEAQQKFTSEFLAQLQPTQTGMVILPIKQQGLTAAQGTQDFSGLFIGFSFFVIAAATVLIALLFRLSLENRAVQTGQLSAVGFHARQVRNLLLSEALLILLIGIALGIPLGIAYAKLMIFGLTTWWKGAIGTSYLQLSLAPASLAIGALIAFAVPLPVLWLSIRKLLKTSPKDRLHGIAYTESASHRERVSKKWIAIITLSLSILLTLGSLTGITPQTEAFGGFNWRIVSFFTGGFLSLIGSLLLYVLYLRLQTHAPLSGSHIAGAISLGFRNPARQKNRSTITVVLVALATFVVIAVAAGRQNPTRMTPELSSGNGGFSIVAESARPVLFDLTTPEGQQQLGLFSKADAPLQQLLEQAKIFRFRVRPGENASCLNLYQTRLPTILGVPQEMIDRGGFAFADTPGENPWKLLQQKLPDDSVPVMGDMNTLQYSLHKPIGSQIELPSELGISSQLQVVGSLAGSVFQGVLLMSEENFLQLFPNISGYNYFLIETPLSTAPDLTRLLETRLVTFGFDAEPVGRRLQNFLAVQNTYLSTFQALGGLGLLLGTLGLGTVMLRNVLERSRELALMRAVGFTRSMLAWMVLAENASLLLIGLFIGTITALWSMLPQILSAAGDVPWTSGILLLLAVFITGMLAASAAVWQAVRTPILTTLRGS